MLSCQNYELVNIIACQTNGQVADHGKPGSRVGKLKMSENGSQEFNFSLHFPWLGSVVGLEVTTTKTCRRFPETGHEANRASE